MGSKVFYADPEQSPEIWECDYTWDNRKGGREEFLRAVEGIARIVIAWECGLKVVDEATRASFCYIEEREECRPEHGTHSGIEESEEDGKDEGITDGKGLREVVERALSTLTPEEIAREAIRRMEERGKILRTTRVSEHLIVEIIVDKLKSQLDENALGRYEFSLYALVRQKLGGLVRDALERANEIYSRIVLERLEKLAKECLEWARRRGRARMRKNMLQLCLAGRGVYLSETMRNLLWELVRTGRRPGKTLV